MKYTKRTEKGSRADLGTMQINNIKKGAEPTLTLFIDDGCIDLGAAFVYDAIEFYFDHLISIGLKEMGKKRKGKKK